uniref:Uncharacterized protein n=1 Tax=Mycena chlorophos TaxID=658473 RepID=A0ABQ0L0G1_MYCCL|nr:predicted protein [Mycena chlorophos]
MTSAVRALMRRAARHFLCDWVERLKGKTTVGRCCADEGLRDTRDTPSVLFTRPAALVFVKTETGHGGAPGVEISCLTGNENPRPRQHAPRREGGAKHSGARQRHCPQCPETPSDDCCRGTRGGLLASETTEKLRRDVLGADLERGSLRLEWARGFNCWPCHRSLSSSSSV